MQELNFYHTPRLCIAKYNQAAIKILQSSNACSIKRLSVPSCFFIRKLRSHYQKLFKNLFISEETEVGKEDSNWGFKRPRRGVVPSSNPIIKKIADKLTALEDLEVWFCEQ